MQVIYHAFVIIIVFIPLYLVLAGYSLRYYATAPNVSREAILVFLRDVQSMLHPLYSEHSRFNLITSDATIDIPEYLRTQSHSLSLTKRIYLGIGAIIVIASICVSLTKQKETVWFVEHIILIAVQSILLYWSWYFGENIINQ